MRFIDTISQWDIDLLLALNGSESLYLDGIMWTITRTSTWLLLFGALFYIVIRNTKLKQSLVIFILVALLITVADQVASGICKPLFQRFRPTHDPIVGPMIDIVNGYRGGKYGFFSSHASNTFVGATFFALLFRNVRVSFLLFIWATLCTYSRLYLGVHYPTDILTGLTFGILSGYVFHFLYAYVGKRYFCQTSLNTTSSYAKQDFLVFYAAFALSCIYILIRALWYADSF